MIPDELQQRIELYCLNDANDWEYIRVECDCPDSIENFVAEVNSRDVESIDQAVYSIEYALSVHREETRYDPYHEVEPKITVGPKPIVLESPED